MTDFEIQELIEENNNSQRFLLEGSDKVQKYKELFSILSSSDNSDPKISYQKIKNRISSAKFTTQLIDFSIFILALLFLISVWVFIISYFSA